MGIRVKVKGKVINVPLKFRSTTGHFSYRDVATLANYLYGQEGISRSEAMLLAWREFKKRAAKRLKKRRKRK